MSVVLSGTSVVSNLGSVVHTGDGEGTILATVLSGSDPQSEVQRRGQSSLGFICTVTSSMMGSTLMTLPWAFENAGFGASLIMILIVGAVSYYTCFLVLHWGAHPNGDFQDFSDLCSHYIGPWSRHVANGTSVGVCVGVCATYHVLIANSLQNVILAIGDLAHLDITFFCCGSGNFEYALSSVVVGVCVFPLLCVRTIDRLMAIGSYGGISVLYNVVFVVGGALANWPDEATRAGRSVKVAGDMSSFGVFFGQMGLSLFIHNLVLQLCRGHSCSTLKPSTVKRDVGIAYSLAAIFYTAVGAVPAMAYELGSQQFSNARGELPQNILLAYDHSSWGALIGQTLLLLQIMVVYPLIATVIRRQFFSSVIGTDWPGWPRAICFSISLLVFTTLVAASYPKPGNVVGYVGVYTAIVYMLALPLSVHMLASKAANRASVLSMICHVILFAAMTFAFLMQFIF